MAVLVGYAAIQAGTHQMCHRPYCEYCGLQKAECESMGGCYPASWWELFNITIGPALLLLALGWGWWEWAK